MAKGIGGFFKSLKKKITLRGVVGAVAGVAGAIPVIGGVIQTAANAIEGARGQAAQAAQQASQQAQQQLQQAAGMGASSGTFQTAPTGPQPAETGLTFKNPLVWVGVGLAALFLLKRK